MKKTEILKTILAAFAGLIILSNLPIFGARFPETSLKGPEVPTWVVQKSGVEASLRGVSAVDEKTAWASGSKGTVLRTIDGGEKWTAVMVPGAESLDFRDIEAFSAETAIVMSSGRPAKIFRTTDGGGTWEERYSNDEPGIFLDAMAFFDDSRGLAGGDPMGGRFVLLATADGGKTWSMLPDESRPEAKEGEGAFAASGTCLATWGRSSAWFCTGGPVSRIFRSENGGRRWEAVASPLLSGQASYGTFSVAFTDSRNGIAVGGDYRNEPANAGNAAVTADGGKTWTLLMDAQPGGFREAVLFAPLTTPDLAVSVGPSGSDYSLDLGKTWKPIAGTSGFHSLSFAKKGKVGWAVGKNGLIAKLAY